MVYGGYNVELEFAIRGCLEDTGINLDLLDTRPIKLLERCNDARFLPCARWSVYEEMGEVTALCLRAGRVSAADVHSCKVRTRAFRRSESSGW